MSRMLAREPRRHRFERRSDPHPEWIHARAIGFGGFGNEADVVAAAAAGWKSLQQQLHHPHAVHARLVVDWDRLRFVRDGAHEWVSDGRIPLARVYRMGPSGSGARPVGVDAAELVSELAIEFVVPSWIGHDQSLAIAGAIRRAIDPLRPERETMDSAVALIHRRQRQPVRTRPDPPSAA